MDNFNEEKIVNDLIRNPSMYDMPNIISVQKALGGVVHSVWELETEKGKFYLKIRGNRFDCIPEIQINPKDIAYEYKAIVLLSNLMPEHFPHPVFFESKRSFLIMTDVMKDGERLEKLLLQRKVTQKMLYNLGATLRKIHVFCNTISKSIRENKEEFYRLKLYHRLGYRNNPTLDEIIKKMATYEPRQIIIGDGSPKNIGVCKKNGLFTFFDLEDVHKGNIAFEVGFFAGHLVLHSLADKKKAINSIESFFDGYQSDNLNEEYIKAIALGAIMYRLDSIIPYSVKLPTMAKSAMIKKIEDLLADYNLNSISWAKVIKEVFKYSS